MRAGLDRLLRALSGELLGKKLEHIGGSSDRIRREWRRRIGRHQERVHEAATAGVADECRGTIGDALESLRKANRARSIAVISPALGVVAFFLITDLRQSMK
jgi:hypothetical protein